MLPASGAFNHARIPELNGLMAKVKASHDEMLESKRGELLEIVRQCMAEIHTLAGDDPKARSVSQTADNYFDQQKQKIASYRTLALLDGLVPPIWQYKDETVGRMEAILHPPSRRMRPEPSGKSSSPHRQVMFPQRR